MSRPWPAPLSDATTIHAIGDVHTTGNVASTTGRLTQTGVDAAAAMVQASVAVVQVGDMINNNSSPGDPSLTTQSTEDTASDSWVSQYFTVPATMPFYRVLGNHDLAGGLRTADQWAARIGLPSKNQSYYVGSGTSQIRLLIVGPDTLAGVGTDPFGSPAIILSSATVSWLDSQLSQDAAKPTWLICHAPLPGTSIGSGQLATQASGTAVTDLLSVIAAHSNIIGWLSGHTHIDYLDSRASSVITVGSQKIACVDTSTLTARNGVATDQTPNSVFWNQYYNGPWVSPYVSYNGDHVEVRWRNHQTHQWHPQGSTPVTLLSLR